VGRVAAEDREEVDVDEAHSSMERFAEMLRRPGAYIVIHPNTMQHLKDCLAFPPGTPDDVAHLRVYTSPMAEAGTIFAIDPAGLMPQMDMTDPWWNAREWDVKRQPDGTVNLETLS